MLPYLLSIDLRLELADDAEARETVGDRELEAIARAALTYAAPTSPEKTEVTVKWQRIHPNRPPRLLAQWPPSE